MDAGQIRTEMSHTRESIDRKLDVLSARVNDTKERTRRSASIAGVAAVALFVVWRWRRQQRASRQRAAMNRVAAMKQVATVTRHESKR